MSLTSPDFESGAYTNFATPAAGEDDKSSGSEIATGGVATWPRINADNADQIRRLRSGYPRSSAASSLA